VELAELKARLLELLRKDEEFRLAVAGLSWPHRFR